MVAQAHYLQGVSGPWWVGRLPGGGGLSDGAWWACRVEEMVLRVQGR